MQASMVSQVTRSLRYDDAANTLTTTPAIGASLPATVPSLTYSTIVHLPVSTVSTYRQQTEPVLLESGYTHGAQFPEEKTDGTGSLIEGPRDRDAVDVHEVEFTRTWHPSLLVVLTRILVKINSVHFCVKVQSRCC